MSHWDLTLPSRHIIDSHWFATLRWLHQYRIGMSPHAAAEDTLVFMTLFGFEDFKLSVYLLQSRNLIPMDADIVYGGHLRVGMIPVMSSDRWGEIIDGDGGFIDPYYLLRVDSGIQGVANDPLVFWQEVAHMLPPGFRGPKRMWNLPRIKLGKLLRAGEDTSCAICHDEIAVDSDVILLMQCRHWFCVDCLNSWLGETNDTCPMCRCHVDALDRDPQLPYYEDVDQRGYDADDER